MQQDTRMDVITIVIRRDIFIGEAMITGITLTDHTLVEFITTPGNTMNGEDIMDITATIVNF